MARLKNRQMFIPHGFRYYVPETNWNAPRNASFEIVVQALIAHRKGNSHLRQQHNWSIDHATVANEVDAYNAAICEKMGWNTFIQSPIGAGPPPKPQAPSPGDQNRLVAAAGQVKRIWSGIRTLSDWWDSGEPGVPQEQAEGRAKACVACPRNEQGDFSRWFTQPAAEAIRRQMEKAKARNLKTSVDEQLMVCGACLCPMRLKVHTPLKHINAHLTEDVLSELQSAPACWIVAERNK